MPVRLTALCGGTVTGDAMRKLGEAIRTLFAGRTKQQLLDAALAHGFVLAPVNSAQDVLRSPQFEARDAWWRDGSIDDAGRVREVQRDAADPAPPGAGGRRARCAGLRRADPQHSRQLRPRTSCRSTT